MKLLESIRNYFSIAIFAFLSLPIFAQGMLSGNMVDIFHNPIEHETIALVAELSETILAKGKTGSGGKFTFEYVEPGTYFIEVHSDGCKPFRSEKIVVKPVRQSINFASVMMDGCVP